MATDFHYKKLDDQYVKQKKNFRSTKMQSEKIHEQKVLIRNKFCLKVF